MNDPDRPPSKSPQQLRREKRLAEALRANLRRRKAAERRGDAPAPEPAGAMKGRKALAEPDRE